MISRKDIENEAAFIMGLIAQTRETTMVEEVPGVIAGRDEKGKPLTAEEVEERTKKKLEEDEKKSEKVREQLKGEAEEATKAAEAQEKADKEFLKKQEKEAEKAEAKEAKAEPHPTPQQGRHR